MAEDAWPSAEVNEPLAVAESEFAGEVLELLERFGFRGETEASVVMRLAGDFVEQGLKLLMQPLVARVVDRRHKSAADDKPLVSGLQSFADQFSVPLLAETECRAVEFTRRRIGCAHELQILRQAADGLLRLLALVEIEQPAGDASIGPLRECGGQLSAAGGGAENAADRERLGEVDQALLGGANFHVSGAFLAGGKLASGINVRRQRHRNLSGSG
jgi:hypothetical protein